MRSRPTRNKKPEDEVEMKQDNNKKTGELNDTKATCTLYSDKMMRKKAYFMQKCKHFLKDSSYKRKEIDT